MFLLKLHTHCSIGRQQSESSKQTQHDHSRSQQRYPCAGINVWGEECSTRIQLLSVGVVIQFFKNWMDHYDTIYRYALLPDGTQSNHLALQVYPDRRGHCYDAFEQNRDQKRLLKWWLWRWIKTSTHWLLLLVLVRWRGGYYYFDCIFYHSAVHSNDYNHNRLTFLLPGWITISNWSISTTTEIFMLAANCIDSLTCSVCHSRDRARCCKEGVELYKDLLCTQCSESRNWQPMLQ